MIGPRSRDCWAVISLRGNGFATADVTDVVGMVPVVTGAERRRTEARAKCSQAMKLRDARDYYQEGARDSTALVEKLLFAGIGTVLVLSGGLGAWVRKDYEADGSLIESSWDRGVIAGRPGAWGVGRGVLRLAGRSRGRCGR